MAALLGWKVFSALFGALFLVYSVNLKIPILPVTGLTFALSCIFLWFISVSIALFGLQKLMQHKEPISSEFLNRIILGADHVKSKEPPKINRENLKKLVTDIDKYFITKWFCNISSDESFTDESKAFIQESLERLISVHLQVCNKNLLLGIFNIYLKHLKEFRRTLKRREKYENVEIQELYRYAHFYSNTTTNRPRDYYILQLTTFLLKHFINSELWNSLPCHILVAVLARKFTAYLLNIASNPEVINYFLLISIAPENVIEKLGLKQYGKISFTQLTEDPSISDNRFENFNKKEYTCEVDSVNTDENKTNEKQNEYECAATSLEINTEQTKKPQVVLRKRKPLDMPVEKNKNIDSVKIYEPKSSTKTWRDTRDLACVSLGQDPLLEGTHLSPPNSANKIGAKFWEVGVKAEENKIEDSPTTNLFNEMVNMTSIEGLRSSIKPILSDATERTLHNIKDIQESTETTVHNALHKIGDFQVIDRSEVENLTHFNKRELSNLKYPLYLPPHSLLHSSVMVSQVNTAISQQGLPLGEQFKDEAVGVVEGILDFGRAGFRKGLKLTGLQDNIENAKASISQAVSNNPKPKDKPKPIKISNSVTTEIKSSSVDSAKSVEESCWINPLQCDLQTFDDQVLLEKRVFDKSTKLEEISIPSISTEYAPSGTNSPDPEYEDAADLASSIAKLRSLLQQRSSESSLSTPALSPMPDEYKQMESETASDVEVDGVMPSFYKFCTKTASGVLNNTINTLKTALPSNNNEQTITLDNWMFKADLTDSDVLVRMKKLLSERKEYCVLDKDIDTAYEAIDSIDFCQTSPVISNLQFEDELDEFELKIPITKTLVDIFCELMADTDSAFIREPLVKAFLLILGNPLEKVIEAKIEILKAYFAEHLITIPEKSNTEVFRMEFNEYLGILLNSIPEPVKILLSKESVKSALNLLTSSLQTQKINQDTLLQVFELLVLKLIEESTTASVLA